MARIRTIKPEFFTSEDIVNLSALARLLYIALWCECDREGRMVWKPHTFKMRYFPGDDCDIHALCDEITRSSLVVLYGGKYAVIPTFHSHQHINPRESVSQLPAPDAFVSDGSLVPTREPRVSDASSTSDTRVHDASLTREPRDSDAQGGREGKGREGNGSVPVGVDSGKPLSRSQPVEQTAKAPMPPISEIVNLYHSELPELPPVRLHTESRKRAIAKLWRWIFQSKRSDGTVRANSTPEAVAWMQSYFSRARDNDFLMGRGVRSAGHENWRCDFDFLLTEKGMKHVLEKTGGGS